MSQATYAVLVTNHPPYLVKATESPRPPVDLIRKINRRGNRRGGVHLGRRLVCYPGRNRDSVVYRAEVKGPGERVFLGTFASEAEARAAGVAYMETGIKPPARQRGRKKGQRTWPKGVPKGEIEVPAPPPAERPIQGFGETTIPRPPIEPPMTKEARLEMIKRIAGRLA